MITVSQIRNGSGYMRRHLSANDYYSEHEQVIGQWHGKTAQALGLEGQSVTEEAFEALRSNRHPETEAKLTPRRPKVAFHDFVISAPKSVSIAAMVGGDRQLIEAYDRCVLKAFERLERYAGVRVRQGKAVHTEETRRTGNAIAAIFRHDTSRLLDPQLHSHLVFVNVSWDDLSERWLALQPKEMAEQSKAWIRQEFYRDLERECYRLGYSTQQDGESFRLAGIDHSIDHAFSQRAVQRDHFINRYQSLFGQEPSKKRVEHFIKDQKGAATKRFVAEYQERFGSAPSKEAIADFIQDWRSSKMAHSTREKVHALQQSRITPEQATSIRHAVRQFHEEAENHQQNQAEMPKEMWEDWQQSLHTEREDMGRKHEALQQKKARLRHLKKAKTGKEIAAALRGHPTKIMALRVQQLAKKKHYGTQRRTY